MADLSFSLGDILALLTAVVVVVLAYYKLNSSISAIRKGNSALKEVLTANSKSFGSLIGHLAKKGMLGTEEVADISSTSTSAVENLLSILTTGNPITPQEAQRLQEYYNKMLMGQPLTESEAQEFYMLSSGVSQERPTDARALLLLGLAAFAVGYLMGSSDKDGKKRK